MSEEEDRTVYTVVRNDEEQYSIWAVGRPVPAGWTEVGRTGPKAECLAFIREVWTDLRPASLRREMEPR
jgi:MbtH protein